MDARDRQEIERQLNQMREEIRALTRRIPARWARPDTLPWTVKVAGGQMVNTVVPCIFYAADPLTAPKTYNPLSDTSYIAGLGYGELDDPSGLSQGLVIIRHNWAGTTSPLIVGNRYVVGQPTTVAVSGGGSITVYPVIGR